MISPGSRLLGTGTPWTTGVDRHDVITPSSNPVVTDAANGRFVIDVGDLTNLALAFNVQKAEDPAAETFSLDLWFGRLQHAGATAKNYEITLEWQGVYTVTCATSGSGLAVPTTSRYNQDASAFCKWCDNIADPGTNPYAFTTRLRRVNSGRAIRSWDLAGYPIVVGQVSSVTSGVSIGGSWWRF